MAEKLLEDALEHGIFSCGVLATVLYSGETCIVGGGIPPTCPAAAERVLFDLASLTKAVATTSLAMLLVDEGLLDIDAPVSEYLPDFLDCDHDHAKWRGMVTSRMLLAHCGGFSAGHPFWKSGVDGHEEKLRLVRQSPLANEPGTVATYSDIGMMVVGQLIERLTGQGLDRLSAEKVFAPLGMSSTCFNPSDASVCIPTEEIADAPGRFWQGVVHDENARWLGGVSGHAGLFSCAGDLAKFCKMLLNGGNSLFSPSVFDMFTRKARLVDGSSRCLGWDGYSEGCAGGARASEHSFGHTGFTGTSLWADRDNGIAVVLLTNAVHPHRECKSNGYFRRRNEIHTACYDMI